MNEFRPACKRSEFGKDDRHLLELDGREVLLVHHAGHFHAVGNCCACLVSEVGHPGTRRPDQHVHDARLAPLADATIDNGQITCPEHRSVYDLASGKPLSGFAEVPLNVYEVRERDGTLEVATRSNAERLLSNDL